MDAVAEPRRALGEDFVSPLTRIPWPTWIRTAPWSTLPRCWRRPASSGRGARSGARGTAINSFSPATGLPVRSGRRRAPGPHASAMPRWAAPPARSSCRGPQPVVHDGPPASQLSSIG